MNECRTTKSACPYGEHNHAFLLTSARPVKFEWKTDERHYARSTWYNYLLSACAPLLDQRSGLVHARYV